MITCKNCQNTDVMVHSMNFAFRKAEGQASVVGGAKKDSFLCNKCESQWKTDPKAWPLYYNYKQLSDKNTLTANTMGDDGSYVRQENLNSSELELIHQLAIELLEFQDCLTLDMMEWRQIKEEAK